MGFFKFLHNKKNHICNRCGKNIEGEIFKMKVENWEYPYCEKCWDFLHPARKTNINEDKLRKYMKNSKYHYNQSMEYNSISFIAEIHSNKPLNKRELNERYSANQTMLKIYFNGPNSTLPKKRGEVILSWSFINEKIVNSKIESKDISDKKEIDTGEYKNLAHEEFIDMMKERNQELEIILNDKNLLEKTIYTIIKIS